MALLVRSPQSRRVLGLCKSPKNRFQYWLYRLQEAILNRINGFTQTHDKAQWMPAFAGMTITPWGSNYFRTFIAAGHRIATLSGCLPPQVGQCVFCSVIPPTSLYLSFPRRRESIGFFVLLHARPYCINAKGKRVGLPKNGCLPPQAGQCVVIRDYPCLAIFNRENGFLYSPNDEG